MNQPDASAGEPRAGRNSRLSAEDWAQAALDLIAEQGVGAVAVEPLARRLGVTPVPQTDSGGQVENTKEIERIVVKELGKMPP